MGPSCPAPEPAPLGEVVQIDSVHASLVDQFGEPAADVQCSLCGIDLCSLPASSDASGEVTVSGPGAEQRDPRFNVGYNGRGYAKMVALIPAAPTYEFGTVRVLRLPPFSEGVPLVPGQPATSGGVTVTAPAGASVEFDLITYGDESDGRFVGALFDIRGIPEAELPAVDPALGLEVLIGTGALDTHICPAASLRFENIIGWSPGTEIEIYMNGTKTYDNWVPYGEWGLVAEAVVDPDGATVSTKAGSGIAVLGTVAARAKM